MEFIQGYRLPGCINEKYPRQNTILSDRIDRLDTCVFEDHSFARANMNRFAFLFQRKRDLYVIIPNIWDVNIDKTAKSKYEAQKAT